MPCCADCGKGFGSGGCSGVHSGRWNGTCKGKFKFICNDCMDVFNTKNRRNSHMNKKHTGATCPDPKCKKPFYDKIRCDQHAKDTGHNNTLISSANKSPEVPPAKSNSNKVSCFKCNKQFHSKDSRDQHMRDSRHKADVGTPSDAKLLTAKDKDLPNAKNSCENEKPSSASKYSSSPEEKPVQSINTLSKNISDVSCQQCKRQFPSEDSRNQHMTDTGHKSDQDKQINPCGGCNRQFSNPLQRDQHIKDTGHQRPDMPTGAKSSDVHDINTRARHFHDNNARPPKTPNKDKDFATYNEVTNMIRDEMRKQDIAYKKVCVGSLYERTNIVRKSDFDVMMVQRDPTINVADSSNAPAGYTALNKDGKDLSPRDFMQTRIGQLQKILNKTDFGDYSMKIREHGPAIQVDVTVKSTGSVIPIDVVPAFELKDGSTYVAKIPKAHHFDEVGASSNREMYWHKSNSYEAREKFLKIDLNNGCHREAYRTCKAIRNREPNLHHITSFQLKSAVFALSDKPDKKAWSRDKIGDRTTDILHYVAEQYKDGNLPDYFTPKINLLAQTDEQTRINTSNRLNYLVKHPEKLFPIE